MESIAQFCKGVTLATSKNRYAYSHKQNFAWFVNKYLKARNALPITVSRCDGFYTISIHSYHETGREKLREIKGLENVAHTTLFRIKKRI